MKKLIALMVLMTTILFACTSETKPLQWVHVEGNKFIDTNGQEIVFRGLCFSDPVKLLKDGQWNERYFAEAADWGANIVRFAVHPTNLNEWGWEKTFQAMDEGIEWAKKHDLYVIMDWHSIGNLKDAKYTNPMYDTTLEETFKFWRTVAQRYKDEPTVALYELYNEPTVTGEDTGECTWEEWKAIQEELIDSIRVYNPNALCLCAGFNWAYDLTPVASAPIERPNVAYVSHPYPMKRSQPWEEQWEADFGFVADTYPVICTEMGFCLENELGAHIPVISTEIYGKHITQYFEKKGISFTVWCFDKDWSPTLIEDWDFTPTTQGRFFKAYLQSFKQPRITSIPDNAAPRFMPTSLFPQATDSLIQSLKIEKGIPSSVCAVLVETEGKQILLDTGNGAEDSQLIPILKNKGIDASDIDYIFITHLHGDHIGGLIQNGEAAFQNAQVYIPQVEYDGWMKLGTDQTTTLENLSKIYAERIVLFSENDPLPHGFSSIAAYGHTPGHTLYQIGQNLIVGDIMHGVTLQLEHPEICARFDMDTDKAIESRKAILQLAKEKELTLYGMHFPEPYLLSFEQ